MNTPLPATRHVAFAALCLALAGPALAQQQPITGRMMDGQTQTGTPATPTAPRAATPATPAQEAPPPPPPTDTQQATDSPPPPAYASIDNDGIGSTTRALLHMQVSGNHAGQHLPMLGDEASASYKRYIQSFSHPIPEFFESKVGKNGSNGSGR